MKQIVVHRPGGYERLVVEEHPDPLPGPGQALVGVEAVGVNFADCVVRMGLYASAKPLGWPITPGFEVAGTVKALGEDVDDLDLGRRVIALTRFGAYATSVVAPRHQVFPYPERLSAAEAGGFAVVFLTAYHALFELAHPRPGRSVLVHSAAGGVGGALVQLAKLAGSRVVAAVGASDKVETVRRLGADQVIDKSTEELWAAAERHAPEGYDVVLDANGPATLAASYRHLAPMGKLVVYGFHSMLRRGRGRPSWPKLVLDFLRSPRFDPLRMTGENRSVLAFNLSTLFGERELLANAMSRLFAWLEEGRIAPPTVTTVPFERVADAHRALESGRTVGKLVLVVPA